MLKPVNDHTKPQLSQTKTEFINIEGVNMSGSQNKDANTPLLSFKPKKELMAKRASKQF